MKTSTPLFLLALALPFVANAVESPRIKKNPRVTVFTKYFERYDTDHDGLISGAEFEGSVGATHIPVLTEWRYFFMTDFINGVTISAAPAPEGITLETYIKYAGGLRVPKPNLTQLFDLADADLTGDLDIHEYIRTRKTGTPNGKIVKSFNKIDKDDDGVISPDEFGINEE